jgi:hypothetical protein
LFLSVVSSLFLSDPTPLNFPSTLPNPVLEPSRVLVSIFDRVIISRPLQADELHMEHEDLHSTISNEELRSQLHFQLSLLRLVRQGSADGGARMIPQIAQIEQLLQQ